MNRLQVAAVAAVLCTIAAGCTVRAVRPPVRSLTALRRYLYDHPAPSPVTARPARSSLHARAAVRLASSPVGEWFMTRFAGELRDTATTVPDVLARLVAATVVGFFTAVAAVAALSAANGRFAPVPVLVFGIVGAACGPILFAIGHSTTGSYAALLTACAIASAAIAVVSLMVRRPTN